MKKYIRTLIRRTINFLQFSKAYVLKHNPIVQIRDSFMTRLRDFLTTNQKVKMAKYRLNYQKYKLTQMEQLIAQNNQHVFLKGRTLNEIR
ncbi:MAG: hypothetical protein ACI4CY_02575 [Candidatus Gastranaerophilaceae bacterium]